MATNPDPGKPTRPEDQKTPPPVPEAEAEDAAFSELMDEDALQTHQEGAPPPAPRSGSAVNLGAAGPEGHATPEDSSFPWEDLLGDASEPSGEPARFDAPSDADVLLHAPPESPRAGDSGVSGPTSDVFIAEAALDPDEHPEAQGEAVLYDSDVHLDHPGQEASAVDLGGAPARGAEPEDSSSIDLGGSGTAGAILVDSSSGLDLEGAGSSRTTRCRRPPRPWTSAAASR